MFLGSELAIIVVLILLGFLVLPVIAIYRTRNMHHLELRVAALEAKLAGEREVIPPAAVAQPVEPPETPAFTPAPARTFHLETLVGQKLIGWIAILLIFLAACFFLKYAFENQWIGELGRVTLEIAAGLLFLFAGFDRHRKGWTYFSLVLTAGGITILYLSIYGAFAYYHLIPVSAAFFFLALVVAQSYLLSTAYNAPTIAIVATIGGFLNPVLLNTGRDQYLVLFTYILVLDAGVLAVVIARRWRFLSSLAYLGTQLLFWAWYGAHYHPEKRTAALLFQLAVLLMFLALDAAPRFRQAAVRPEEWARLAVNPFVFYGICYELLNTDRHEWMGALALALAVLYAALARRELALANRNTGMLLTTIGTALTFVTIAIPVQLNADWIAVAWALEAAVFLWAAGYAATPSLRWFSVVLFALALGRYLYSDTHIDRALFTPVFNQYGFETLAITACLGAAAWLNTRGQLGIVLALVAAGVLWFGSSIEAYSYYNARIQALPAMAMTDKAEITRHLRWAGQLSLSLLWSAYAVCLTAAGFRYGQRAFRSAGLVLFGITLLKLLLVDTSELAQFYRIVAFLAVGLLLLGVAWTYQRASKREPLHE